MREVTTWRVWSLELLSTTSTFQRTCETRHAVRLSSVSASKAARLYVHMRTVASAAGGRIFPRGLLQVRCPLGNYFAGFLICASSDSYSGAGWSASPRP